MSEFRDHPHVESAPQTERDHRDADQLLHAAVDNTELRVTELTPDAQHDLERAFLESVEISNYLRQETNIANIEAITDWLPVACADRKLGPRVTEKILKATAYLLAETRTACRHYAQSVARFEHIRRHQLGYDREEAEKLARADRDRRITHDATLDSFRSFNSYVSVKLSDDYGIDVPRTMQFSDSRIFLDRQDYGTEWIQATDYYLQSRSLIELIKKEEAERRARTS